MHAAGSQTHGPRIPEVSGKSVQYVIPGAQSGRHAAGSEVDGRLPWTFPFWRGRFRPRHATHAGSLAPEVLLPEPYLPKTSSSGPVLRASRSKLGSDIANAAPTILRIPDSSAGSAELSAGSAEFRADHRHPHAPRTMAPALNVGGI